MPAIPAIFEKGVFRPLTPVVLPEGSTVTVEIPLQNGLSATRTPDEEAHVARVYDILGRRYDGGESDVAARHDEHQP